MTKNNTPQRPTTSQRATRSKGLRHKKDYFRALLSRLARQFWTAIFVAIIAAAAIVQLCRHAFPLLNDYRVLVADALGERLGVRIELKHIEASWQGLRPKIAMRDVLVLGQQDIRAFSVDEVNAELSLVDSVLQWRWVWREISFRKLDMTFYQGPDNRWHVLGLSISQREESSFEIDDPLDVFLLGREVRMSDSTFRFHFQDGTSTLMQTPIAIIENNKDFHRLEIKVDIDQKEAIHALVEAKGDPRNLADFSQQGYVKVQPFALQKLASLWSEQAVQDIQKALNWHPDSFAETELWFTGTPSQGLSFRGQLSLSEPCLSEPCRSLDHAFSTHFLGAWAYQGPWNVDLIEPELRWNAHDMPKINASLFGNPAEGIKLGLSTAQLDAKRWLNFLRETQLDARLPEQAKHVIAQLDPRGKASNINMQWVEPELGSFRLSARLDQFELQSFRGSPSASGVSGQVYLRGEQGVFDLHSDTGFSMHFDKVYEKALTFLRANGRLSWQVDRLGNNVYVASDVLEVEALDHRAYGVLALQIPIKGDEEEPQMTLAIRVPDIPAKHHLTYVPVTVPSTLRTWLKTGVVEGTVKDAEFIFHGSIDKNPTWAPNIQLVGEVQGGNLAFDPSWPDLDEVNAHLRLDDRRLDVQVYTAKLLGNRVADTQVSLIDNPHDHGLALQINGLIESDTAAAVQLLQNSPVKSAIGDTLDTWEFSGDVSAQVKLIVPLASEAKGTYQSVDVSFDGAEVFMSDIDITLTDVRGGLNYSNQRGVTSSGLSAKLWGKAVRATIDSPNFEKEKLQQEGDRQLQTKIYLSSRVELADIYAWVKRPELKFMRGNAQVQGELTIPLQRDKSRPLTLKLNSRLKGVAFDLPKPFAKTEDEEKNFQAEIKLFNDFQQLHFKYDQAYQFRIQTGTEQYAHLHLGESDFFPQTGVFGVTGKVDEFDLAAWNTVKDKYFNYLDELEKNRLANEKAIQPDMPFKLDLEVADLSFIGLELDQIKVTGVGLEEYWQLSLAHQIVEGELTIYNDDKHPIEVDLKHLRLPKTDNSKGNSLSGALKNFDITQVRPANFNIEAFSLGDSDYGKWQFQLRPIKHGIALESLYGLIRGFEIGHTKESQTRFYWFASDGAQESGFKGEIRAKDVNDELSSLVQERIIQTGKARFIVDVRWADSPEKISLNKLFGSVDVHLKEGSFLRNAKAGENPLLRLIALFNFDTVARRLRLDFSDLARSGFAFDDVQGELHFENGLVELSKPIVVKSSSSKMQLQGSIDAKSETLDTQLVVTLPVTGNLAAAALFTGLLPAAVGVYLVSKLFKKQVDRLSSISYNISGSWDKPEIEVLRIFSDDTSKPKGKK